MAKSDEMELVTVLARIGKSDRDLYRQLRAEAWAMVQSNHRQQDQEQRKAWLLNAS